MKLSALTEVVRRRLFTWAMTLDDEKVDRISSVLAWTTVYYYSRWLYKRRGAPVWAASGLAALGVGLGQIAEELRAINKRERARQREASEFAERMRSAVG